MSYCENAMCSAHIKYWIVIREVKEKQIENVEYSQNMQMKILSIIQNPNKLKLV